MLSFEPKGIGFMGKDSELMAHSSQPRVQSSGLRAPGSELFDSSSKVRLQQECIRYWWLSACLTASLIVNNEKKCMLAQWEKNSARPIGNQHERKVAIAATDNSDNHCKLQKGFV